MVEKPSRVAQLAADGLVKGGREAIFNLKLPMKKRYEEVSQNLRLLGDQLQANGIHAEVHAKQLYHDREEVTVHARRFWSAVQGRRDER